MFNQIRSKRRWFLPTIIILSISLGIAISPTNALNPVAFSDGGSWGPSGTFSLELADLDGDQDLDAYMARWGGAGAPDHVWFNDGAGHFTDSGQLIGLYNAGDVEIADFDNDGDLDAFTFNNHPQAVFLNDGLGNFTWSGQPMIHKVSYHGAVGDIDNDGDVDAVDIEGRIWRNDGTAYFVDTFFYLHYMWNIELGDLDNDGDLDAFFPRSMAAEASNTVWFNDGTGHFFDSGQRLGNMSSQEAALGDLDGDGDLDAFIANHSEPYNEYGSRANRVWFNDGLGYFSDSGQLLGNSFSDSVCLCDIDGDGDLDAFVGNRTGFVSSVPYDRVYLNDGTGYFSESGLALGWGNTREVKCGDIDGDGDPDVVSAGGGEGEFSNRIWINDTPPSVFPPIAEAGPDILNQPPLIEIAFDGSGSAAGEAAYTITKYQWDFGDGSPVVEGQTATHQFPAIYAPDGSIDWSLTATTYTVTLTVTDDHSPPLTDTDTTTVQISPPQWDPIADPDGPYTADDCTPIMLDGSASYDPNGQLYPSPSHPWHGYITSWEWDLDQDGLCDDASGEVVQWSSCTLGDHIISLKVTNNFGYTNTAQTLVEVIHFNDPPVLTVDQAVVLVDEGQVALNSGSAVDPDGDSLNLTSSAGEILNLFDGTWAWSYPTTDGPSESQTVTITADDGQGGVSQVSFDLFVNNVSPVIELIDAPYDPISISDQPITVSGTFSDPGAMYDEPYACTIDYGDGFGPQAGVVAGAVCSGSVSYALPGVYTLEIVVTDKDGGSGSAHFQYVVIYDPSEGFVTGGGWISSPAGAYAADPALSGKATFGFVSKYKKGANVPTGETVFHFNVADLFFDSDYYQWLVVAGPKAQFKGIGTINGDGAFGFMITVIDADLTSSTDDDLFRIKIWDILTDEMIYDNRVGGDDNADPDTALGGGSIKIHKPKE